MSNKSVSRLKVRAYFDRNNKYMKKDHRILFLPINLALRLEAHRFHSFSAWSGTNPVSIKAKKGGVLF